MCDFRIWFQSDEDVYVLQCVYCTIFQVRLRNAAFMFDPFFYRIFTDAVNDAYCKIESGRKEDPIIIPTFNEGMDLLLNEAGLKNLYFLLDATDTEMKTAQMTGMFVYNVDRH